jgi:putative hydrolase of HD superfamily
MWNKDEEIFENDSEHGYQLAMVAMYVIEQDNLPLDTYKAMSLAIVHDVLEVHSGDTPVFGVTAALDTKEDRERQALVELKRQWPNLSLMHELIDEYESKSTDESKFIYALDKLVPMLNNYLDNGRNWKRQKATLNHVISVKIGKIDIDPTVNGYYIKTLELLRERPDLFN